MFGNWGGQPPNGMNPNFQQQQQMQQQQQQQMYWQQSYGQQQQHPPLPGVAPTAAPLPGAIPPQQQWGRPVGGNVQFDLPPPGYQGDAASGAVNPLPPVEQPREEQPPLPADPPPPEDLQVRVVSYLII